MKLKKRKDNLLAVLLSGKNLVLISVAFLFLDQTSKYLSTRILPFVCNSGSAFGVNVGGVVLASIVLAVILTLIYFEDAKENVLALSLIFVGGFSNFIDRVMFGCVRDFIDLKIFPVFNFADILITMGVIIIVYQLWIKRK